MGMMRIAVTIFLLSVSINGMAILAEEMGVNDGLGIDVSTCGGGLFQEKKDEAQQLNPGSSDTGDSFGLWTTAGKALLEVVTIINPAADMARCAGVPNDIVAFVGSVFTFVPPIGIAAYWRGVDL